MNLIKIKNLAEKRGILLKDLAEKINMSYQNLNRCIRENKISANDLEKLSEVLGVPVNYFFESEIEAKKIIQNGNNNIMGNKNSQSNDNAALEACKKELTLVKEILKGKEEIIELLKGKK